SSTTPPGATALSMLRRASTTSSGGTHQSDQEKTTRSNECGSTSSAWAEAARYSTRSASSAGSDRRASAIASADGSKASTCAASAAIPIVRRPSPQPISSTRFPWKSARRRRAARCASSGSSTFTTPTLAGRPAPPRPPLWRDARPRRDDGGDREFALPLDRDQGAHQLEEVVGEKRVER